MLRKEETHKLKNVAIRIHTNIIESGILFEKVNTAGKQGVYSWFRLGKILRVVFRVTNRMLCAVWCFTNARIITMLFNRKGCFSSLYKWYIRLKYCVFAKDVLVHMHVATLFQYISTLILVYCISWHVRVCVCVCVCVCCMCVIKYLRTFTHSLIWLHILCISIRNNQVFDIEAILQIRLRLWSSNRKCVFDYINSNWQWGFAVA